MRLYNFILKMNESNLYPTLITGERVLLYHQKYYEVNKKLDERRKSEILNKIKNLKNYMIRILNLRKDGVIVKSQ